MEIAHRPIPQNPTKNLLADLAEAITLVRNFLDKRNAPLDDIIEKTGFLRNAAIVACKEAVNENDETRKRFEVMCREVFKKYKACVNVQNIHTYRKDRDAIDIVYKSLQQDRNQADISDILMELQRVVDAAIEPTVSDVAANPHPDEDRRLYDISQIDFEHV